MRNPVKVFLNCRKCLEELPVGQSPKSYARTQTGITNDGDIVIWCNRHEELVATLDKTLLSMLLEFKKSGDIDDEEPLRTSH